MSRDIIYQLGIVGGMGPASSNHFVNILINSTYAKTDQEHISFVMFNYPYAPRRSNSILGNSEELIKVLKDTSMKLEKLKVKNVSIPCNTVHYYRSIFINKTYEFIDMLETTNQYLESVYNYKNIVVLGTIGTNISKLYRSKNKKIKYIYPNELIQKKIDETIVKIKSNEASNDDIVSNLSNILDNWDNKENTYLFACTELSIYSISMRNYKIYDIVDALEILALTSIVKTGHKLNLSYISKNLKLKSSFFKI